MRSGTFCGGGGLGLTSDPAKGRSRPSHHLHAASCKANGYGRAPFALRDFVALRMETD
jgi:hypothetical protein